MIHDHPVRLFRDPLVETPVPGLHVENGYLPFFGSDRAQATVGIAQHQERIRVDLFKHLVNAYKYLSDRAAGIACGSVQEMVRFPQSKVIEKDFVELIIIVLPSVYQYVFYTCGCIELFDDLR
jgi:hypothetical protein